MGQQISIDPQLWAQTRRLAFDTSTTASRIVETALAEYLTRVGEPPAELATTKKPRRPIENDPPGPEFYPAAGEKIRLPGLRDEADQRPLDPRLGAPWDEVTKPIDALAPPASENGAMNEPVVVNDPQVAAARAVELARRPITPVPKPTSTKRAKR